MPEEAERFATAEGTARYAKRLASTAHPAHFREAAQLRLSTIGIGTYLGAETDADDARYGEALERALRLGVNVVDTAINYRCQRSERTIGKTLRRLFRENVIARDELVVATKGGYLPFDGSPPSSRRELADYVRRTFVDQGIVDPKELVGGIHCMSPRYVRDQIARSLENLALDAIDVYFLHNPEQQLAEVSREEFAARIRGAFGVLEEEARAGRIRLYGTATWNGYRAHPDSSEHLSLDDLVRIAREAGGEDHRFRAVQLPYNLGMHEAFTLANQRIVENGTEGWAPFLTAARRLGMIVMASASILQGRLARGLPRELEEAFPGLGSDARRSIQFVRSTPGVTTALVGMRDAAHVEQNLKLAETPPAPERNLLKLFQSAEGGRS